MDSISLETLHVLHGPTAVEVPKVHPTRASNHNGVDFELFAIFIFGFLGHIVKTVLLPQLQFVTRHTYTMTGSVHVWGICPILSLLFLLFILLHLLRLGGFSDDELSILVRAAVLGKRAVLGGHGDMYGIAGAKNRPMTTIGG